MENQNEYYTYPETFAVIYSNYFQTGSHVSSITTMIKLDCFREELRKGIEKLGIELTQVWFILDQNLNVVENW